MRKLLISILLASATASPALASPDESEDRQQARSEARAERQQAREAARSERAERPARVERVERFVESHEAVDGTARARAGADRSDLEAVRAARAANRDSFQLGRAQRVERRQQRIEQIQNNGDLFQGDQRVEQRQQRIDQMQSDRELRQSTRPVPRVFRNRVPVVSETPQEGTQPPLRAETRRPSSHQWSTGWRKSSKYDWYNWRKRNRWLFNLGFYYDPFGWNYRPYSIGWRMWPSYYSSRYWLHDPWQYRLPYAPPGYRWIRYWDDAILVDTWSGQVVDVIHNFFW